MSSDLNLTLSSMTGARQTMRSWAKVIDSFEALPDIYKAPFQTQVGRRDPFPYTVFAPAQGGFRGKKFVEKLLCDQDDRIYVFEPAGRQVLSSSFAYADIRCLELGNVLLYSWFSMRGQNTAGAEAAATVAFNEACLRHFEPFFSKMRPAPVPQSPADVDLERDKFNHLYGLNYKFMNFARNSLVDGEKVVQFIYQPDIRRRLASMLGHSLYRTLSLAHLTILTDQELILIEDTESAGRKKGRRYGGVWSMIPLRQPLGIQVAMQPEDLLQVTFQVSPALQLKRLFDASQAAQIEALTRALTSALSGALGGALVN